jgi:hypothetical protein
LQPLFACHGRATQAEKAAWRRQQELRAGRLDSLAVVVPKAGMVRAVLRMVPVAAADVAAFVGGGGVCVVLCCVVAGAGV